MCLPSVDSGVVVTSHSTVLLMFTATEAPCVDTAVRTALRRGLPILIQIGGGDLAAFPDCWAVGVPGGYRLRAPAEPGPATTATLAYLGITPASKLAAGPGHSESPKAAPDTSPPPVVVGTAEQQAEQALRTARREVTPAAIAKLAPHPIPHNDPEKRSAWLQLVRGGMTPTPAAVAGLVADKAARRARRVQEAADVAEIAARDGVAAAVAVARIVEDTGTGPTWTELRSTLGWPRNASRGIIPKLIQAGWLTSSGDHRSLRPDHDTHSRRAVRIDRDAAADPPQLPSVRESLGTPGPPRADRAEDPVA